MKRAKSIHMNNLLACALGLVAMALITSCNGSKPGNKDGACHIRGSISTRFNDVKIFLVPTVGPQDAAHVDSVHIKDGKFEFTKDTVGIYDLRLDFRYRRGIQQLIVVTEPGEVKVHIGQESEAIGTPQNDSLNEFKKMTESRHKDFVLLKQRLDSINITKEARRDTIRKYQANVRADYAAFARRQPEGVLRDELIKRYPGKKD